MTETKPISLNISDFAQISVGRLGALTHQRASEISMLMAALDMAERRILRIEMAMRRAGIEPELVELPK